ncbi:hypothetical protein [Polaribacter sp. R77954]|uniref:hypothetical protein n=1 Tax=Polaribacter sp. R77954 TaxID=3093870 RepID=UPI0037CADC3E
MKTVSKSIFILVTIVGLVLCSSCETNQEAELDITQNNIELLENGEWLLKDFEETIMYTFANGERATYYGENSVFSDEPIPGKHAFTFQENILTIDLNFGNIVTYEVQFSCDNNIVEFYEDGQLNSTLYKRDTNYTSCL